jgi:DNA helicase HerA-like ATPase
MLVGKIVGRTSPESFVFEVSKIIRKMDFVAVRDPENHWVLGRIEAIHQEKDRTLAKVSVIGYVDKKGVVRKPRMPFRPGSYIYKSEDGLIKRVLGLKPSGFYVGLLEGSESLKVSLDPKKIITKHLAVLAKTGTGKSYFLGVLIEEFMESKIPAVIIDPHGEYTALAKANDNIEEIKYMRRFDIKPKGYSKQLNVYSLERNLGQGMKKLKLSGKLTTQEIFDMLPFRLTTSQLSVIYSAVRDNEKERYTIDEIMKEVENSKSKAKWNVINVLDFLKRSQLFDNVHYAKPEQLVKKGTVTIINMKGVDPDVQQLVTYKIAKDLFESRKHKKIPPFLFVVEEAHNFCPERGFGGEAISSRILRTIASEGRKFAMGLAVVSQRPARVEKSVLSQCNTQVFLRVTNPNDLKTIMDSVEGATRGIEAEIRALPIGTALIVGVIDQPLIVNIRIKRSNHGGDVVLLDKKMKRIQDPDTLYFFPKFLEDDIKKNIKKRLEQFKLIYYPLWRLNCKFKTREGEKIDTFFVDGLTGEMWYNIKDRIRRTKGLPELLDLKTKEKAVLLYLTTFGISTFEQMQKKLKIKDTELLKILESLEKDKLVEVENKEYKSTLDLNFEEIIENQITEDLVSYNYSGEMIPFKVDMKKTDKVLDLFKPHEVERKKCYYPFWLIFYNDGDVHVVDSLTGLKDKHLSEGSFEDF